MHEPVNRQRHFTLCSGRTRTCGARQFRDEFARAVLQHLGGAIKYLAAIVSRGFAPTTLCGSGCYDGIPEIFPGRVAVIIQLLAAGGCGGQIATALAAWKFAADVELVSFFDVEARCHGQRLERGCGFGKCGGAVSVNVAKASSAAKPAVNKSQTKTMANSGFYFTQSSTGNFS